MVMRVNIVNKKHLRNRSPLVSINDLEKKDKGVETNLLKLAEKYMHSQNRQKIKYTKDRMRESKGEQVKIVENKFGHVQDEGAYVRSEIESLQRIERLGSSQHFKFDQQQAQVPQTVNLTGVTATPAFESRNMRENV